MIKRILLSIVCFGAAFYERPSSLIFDTNLLGINFSFKPVYLGVSLLLLLFLTRPRHYLLNIIKKIEENTWFYIFSTFLVISFIVPGIIYPSSDKFTFFIFLINFSILLMLPAFIEDKKDLLVVLWSFVLGVIIYSSSTINNILYLVPFQENQYGLGLAFSIFVCIFLTVKYLIEKKYLYVALYALLTFLSVYFMVLDRSRGSWVGFGVGIILLILFGFIQLFKKDTKTAIKILGVSVATLVMFLGVVFNTRFISQFESLYTWNAPVTVEEGGQPLAGFLKERRINAWKEVVNTHFSEVKVVGKGINFDATEGVHNTYLKTLISAGLPGLIAFLLMILTITKKLLIKSFSGISSKKTSMNNVYSICILAGILTWLVHGVTDSILLESSIWLVLAFAITSPENKNRPCACPPLEGGLIG